MTFYTTLFSGLTVAAALSSCAAEVAKPSGPLSAEGQTLVHNQRVWLPSRGTEYMLLDAVRVDLSRSCRAKDEVVIMPTEGTYLGV